MSVDVEGKLRSLIQSVELHGVWTPIYESILSEFSALQKENEIMKFGCHASAYDEWLQEKDALQKRVEEFEDRKQQTITLLEEELHNQSSERRAEANLRVTIQQERDELERKCREQQTQIDILTTFSANDARHKIYEQLTREKREKEFWLDKCIKAIAMIAEGNKEKTHQHMAYLEAELEKKLEAESPYPEPPKKHY